MRRNGRVTLLIGVALAILTFVVVLVIGSGSSGTPAPSAPTQAATVVAAIDIPVGTVVTADMVRNQQLEATARDAGAFGDVSAVIGKTVRRNVLAGAQVIQADFETSGGLAVDVPKGLRAFAVSVDQLTGVGNILNAGDHVDIVITLDDAAMLLANPQIGTPDWQLPPTSHNVATTVKAPLLLQDVQVLGTISAPAAAAAGTATGATGTGSGAQPSQAPTITDETKLIILAVTPQQAEALIYTRTVGGTLNLVLRATGDTDTVTTSGVDLGKMFDTYGVLAPFVQRDLDIFIARQR